MFDKLIVSEPEGAEFKTRRRYFMVSSLVVGVLFASAVIASIYAADFDLGKDNIELVEMIAPPDLVPVDPEIPEPQPQRETTSTTTSDLPTRQANIARIDESQFVPTTASVVPHTQLSRPNGKYELRNFDSDPGSPGTSGRDVGSGVPSEVVGLSTRAAAIEQEKDVEPPPIKKEPVRKTQSLGVVNGLATDLPRPVYSAAARAIGAHGKVDVQVLIDESGRVVSARALGGHLMLRDAAELAARRARFTPTLLSKIPVKVTGVITYNFTR